MTALSIIISIVLILVSIVLIVAVLMQEGQRQGLGAIGGGAETFFGKNLASSAEGKLKLITKIAAAVFVVLAIVATIITAKLTEDVDLSSLTTDTTTETHVHEDGTVHEGAEHVEGEEEAATTDDAAATTDDAAATTDDAAATTDDAAATTDDAAATTDDAATTTEDKAD